MEVSAKRGRSPPHIPIEMIGCILMKLKIKAVIRSQCVCKEWLSTIQDPNFKLSYRGRRRLLVVASDSNLTAVTSIFRVCEANTLRIVGENCCWWSGVWCSCNGLVLFSIGKHILLWNPSTRCCTKVFELPLLKDYYLWHRHNVVFASGLCYVPSTRDYKAVLLLETDNVLVASLKNKEWRKVLFPYDVMCVRGGINFHNTLHWRVSDSRDSRFSERCEKVIYFEAESEEFKELPIPTFPLGEYSAILGLGIIDGHLSMARKRWKGTWEVKVLVMKEYGVKKSWVTQFVIHASKFRFDFSHTDFTFCSSKCNTKVLIWRCFHVRWGTLVYDLKNNKLENCLEESGHQNATIYSYVESFVSPHEFVGRDDDQHKSHENDARLRYILERFNM